MVSLTKTRIILCAWYYLMNVHDIVLCSWLILHAWHNGYYLLHNILHVSNVHDLFYHSHEIIIVYMRWYVLLSQDVTPWVQNKCALWARDIFCSVYLVYLFLIKICPLSVVVVGGVDVNFFHISSSSS